MKISRTPNPYRSGEEKRFTMRMDAGLFDAVSELANLHHRSVAKEIEEAIDRYVMLFESPSVEPERSEQ